MRPSSSFYSREDSSVSSTDSCSTYQCHGPYDAEQFQESDSREHLTVAKPSSQQHIGLFPWMRKPLTTTGHEKLVPEDLSCRILPKSKENQDVFPAKTQGVFRHRGWVMLLSKVVLLCLTLVLASLYGTPIHLRKHLLIRHSGIIHITLVVSNGNKPEYKISRFGQNLHAPGLQLLGSAANDVTEKVAPVPCHSHNDYWRKDPLFDAIRAGCISVEADVWLIDNKSDLYVGHDKSSLSSKHTLQKLYIEPLVEILSRRTPNGTCKKALCNGVFEESPKQSLVLLLDFKTNGHELFPHVQQQLEELRKRNFLTYWDGFQLHSGPITVVASGNAPFDLIVGTSGNRDIFFDAPLEELWEPLSLWSFQSVIEDAKNWNPSTSYYASTSFKKSIGHIRNGRISHRQLETIRGHIRGAHRRGLRVRYWDAPTWPTSLRNLVWETLVDQGADVLSVDDIEAAAFADWRNVKHGWFDA